MVAAKLKTALMEIALGAVHSHGSTVCVTVLSRCFPRSFVDGGEMLKAL
jgi:hypothetical protein